MTTKRIVDVSLKLFADPKWEAESWSKTWEPNRQTQFIIQQETCKVLGNNYKSYFKINLENKLELIDLTLWLYFFIIDNQQMYLKGISTDHNRHQSLKQRDFLLDEQKI